VNLPSQQATKIELHINLKAVNTLGVTLSRALGRVVDPLRARAMEAFDVLFQPG
jgi:hypothetical protein